MSLVKRLDLRTGDKWDVAKLTTTSRPAGGRALFTQDRRIDFVNPRRRRSLVTTRIPVMGHADGLYMYLDASANHEQALACHSRCQDVRWPAGTIWSDAARMLPAADVQLLCDEQTLAALGFRTVANFATHVLPAPPDANTTKHL
ncbi:hypothetical protein EI94DRAFT_1800519 [Lactarius quietus]|nr:hypothetical protein EI94DRAFT_1800519 [Lactarius quietus]